jgi:large conductance mechanosensitive channel
VPLFAYGNFLTVAPNFLILAFIILIMVRQINRLRQPVPVPVPTPTPAPAAPPEDTVLLREIRDALRR